MLIWQVNTKRNNSKIIPNPAGISDPTAITYIPVCGNSVQIKSVSPLDPSAVLKGIMCLVPLMIL